MRLRTFFFISLSFILCYTSVFPSEGDSQIDTDGLTTLTIQSLFPLSSDFSWRYERTSREGVSHYATTYMGTLKKDNEIFHILSNPFGVSYYSSDAKSLTIRGLAELEDMKNVFFYKEGDIVRLQAPIRQGTRWQGRAIMEKEKDIIITAYETEILGWGKTEVPAGNFDSVITSSTQQTIFIKKESGQGKGMLTFEQVWYSPGIGMVRRDMYFLYPGDVRVPFRDDKLEEIIREKQKKD